MDMISKWALTKNTQSILIRLGSNLLYGNVAQIVLSSIHLFDIIVMFLKKTPPFFEEKNQNNNRLGAAFLL